MTGITLDAGALIAIEKNDRRVVTALRLALDEQMSIVVPAGVVGQVWRDGRRQVRLARLLGSSRVSIEPLDDDRARAAGQLCGATRTKDAIDASVVIGAKARGDRVFTSDPEELHMLDPEVALERV